MFLYVEGADAVFQRAIAAGTIELMPVEDSEDCDRRGGMKDPFGHIWYIGTHVEDISCEKLPITASFATTHQMAGALVTPPARPRLCGSRASTRGIHPWQRV
jgi:hypothetical protein